MSDAKQDGAPAYPDQKLLWLWVPAFAGTTALFAARQRCTDQRAIEAFGQCAGAIEAEPREAFRVGGVWRARKTLPQQCRQLRRRALRGLQQLQRRDQPLLDVGKIAAERERRQQPRLARRFQRGRDPLRKILAIRGGNRKIPRQ